MILTNNLLKQTFRLVVTLIAVVTCFQAQAGGKDAITQSIVKIIATHNHPDYDSPWQRHGIHTVTGSGAIIEGKRILTNAHVVADQTLVEVQREGSGNTYTASVEYVCHTCDLALLNVKNNAFFEGSTPLKLDGLPELQSHVAVYGFPTGGETISITQGIVSRIEVDYYVHSSDRYLLVQVDAAINPGNSGGPVISNGKIIGIAMQSLEHAENIGYIVPTPIIDHFLLDIKDGKLDGFPELDVFVQLMENDALRQYVKLPRGRGGLLVTGIGADPELRRVFKPMDVILELDGYSIGNDGKINLTENIRVESTHVEYLKQVGDKMKIMLLRDGKIQHTSIKLMQRKRRANNKVYDVLPRYFMFAGLVFQPLSNGYLKSNRSGQFGLMSYIPEYTLQNYIKSIPDRIQDKRKEIVVLSRVLPDAINRGYKNAEGTVIYSVNGEVIRDLKHLTKVIDKAKGKYLKIVNDLGNIMILDLKLARKSMNRILDNYQVYTDRSADLM